VVETNTTGNLTGSGSSVAVQTTTYNALNLPTRANEVSQAWIAENLSMKNAFNVSRVIHRRDLSQLKEKVSGNLRRFVSEKMKENEH
jgi:hypothetical protein